MERNNIRKPIKIKKSLKNKTWLYSSIINANRNRKKGIKLTKTDYEQLLSSMNNHIEIPTHQQHLSSLETELQNFIESNKSSKTRMNKRKIMFNNELLKSIIDDTNNIKSLQEIKLEYIRKTNCKPFSLTTLRRYMRNYLGYRYIMCTYKNHRTKSVQNFESIYYFAQKMKLLMEESHTITFLDESSFRECGKRKIWINKKDTKLKYFSGRLKSISCMAIICQNGIINYELNQNTFNSNSFINFMENTEKKLLKIPYYKNQIDSRKFTVVMDNARLHTSRLSRSALKKGKINIIFQPPYMPIFNACELLWGYVKRIKNKTIFDKM